MSGSVSTLTNVPILNATENLPVRPSRVLVAGASGAGKTTVAARIGEILEMPHVEIDSLFHGPGWTPRASFLAEVEALAGGATWVTEWQYDAVRPLLVERADLLVWLDLARRTVMAQVTWRTLRRRVRRQVLWHGNVEPPLRTVLRDPEHIVRWAWTTHHDSARRVAAVSQRHPELVIVRLESRRQVEQWTSGPLSGVARLPKPFG